MHENLRLMLTRVWQEYLMFVLNDLKNINLLTISFKKEKN